MGNETATNNSDVRGGSSAIPGTSPSLLAFLAEWQSTGGRSGPAIRSYVPEHAPSTAARWTSRPVELPAGLVEFLGLDAELSYRVGERVFPRESGAYLAPKRKAVARRAPVTCPAGPSTLRDSVPATVPVNIFARAFRGQTAYTAALRKMQESFAARVRYSTERAEQRRAEAERARVQNIRDAFKNDVKRVADEARRLKSEAEREAEREAARQAARHAEIARLAAVEKIRADFKDAVHRAAATTRY